MSKKVYARQIAPEWQRSPLEDAPECWPENVIITGNAQMHEHTTDIYDCIIAAYDNAAADAENLRNSGYRNITELINDYFPPLELRGKPYSTRDIHAIHYTLKMYGCRAYYEGLHIAEMLSAITGTEYRRDTLRGTCQSDWNDIYYPAEYGREWLAAFECEYFNTGEEWIFSDPLEAPPDDPGDVDGCAVYVHGWRDAERRAEIADAAGVDPADVVLYEFSGWQQTAVYAEAAPE